MYFKYLAVICGSIGPDVWDQEVIVGDDDLTISQALDLIEKELDSGTIVVSIEQHD